MTESEEGTTQDQPESSAVSGEKEGSEENTDSSLDPDTRRYRGFLGAVMKDRVLIGTDTKPDSAPLTQTSPGPSFEQEEESKQREHDSEMRKLEMRHQIDMQKLAHAHRAKMQKLVLGAVFAALAVFFGLAYVGVWNHGVDPTFAMDMAEMIVPALAGSAATIVGAMFMSGGTGGGGKDNS